MSFYCYILKSINPKYKNFTYVGMTSDPRRRLRQHNGDIVGGAEKTQHKRPYIMYCIIEGFPSRNVALSYEWHFQHPTTKKNKTKYKFKGIEGRIESIKHVLNNKPINFTLTIYVNEEYLYLFTEPMANVVVGKINY